MEDNAKENKDKVGKKSSKHEREDPRTAAAGEKRCSCNNETANVGGKEGQKWRNKRNVDM